MGEARAADSGIARFFSIARGENKRREIARGTRDDNAVPESGGGPRDVLHRRDILRAIFRIPIGQLACRKTGTTLELQIVARQRQYAN
jgi:hypothetical protein